MGCDGSVGKNVFFVFFFESFDSWPGNSMKLLGCV